MTETSCSAQSQDIGEPLAGTGPSESRLLIVEQPGPWGVRALTDSRLLPKVQEAVNAFDAEPDQKVLLARRNNTPTLVEGRNVWLLERSGANVISRHAVVPVAQDPTLLLTDPTSTQNEDSSPVVFICTNSARDKCCALLGRRAAKEIPGAWQVSHVGGHRFAPTGLLYPSGVFLGRAENPVDWAEPTNPPSPLPIAKTRGRLGRQPWQQAAEIAVAELTGGALTDLDSSGPPHAVLVTGPGGIQWAVPVRQMTLASRRTSCAKPAQKPQVWLAGEVRNAD
jgi:hypothetical protein